MYAEVVREGNSQAYKVHYGVNDDSIWALSVSDMKRRTLLVDRDNNIIDPPQDPVSITFISDQGYAIGDFCRRCLKQRVQLSDRRWFTLSHVFVNFEGVWLCCVSDLKRFHLFRLTGDTELQVPRTNYFVSLRDEGYPRLNLDANDLVVELFRHEVSAAELSQRFNLIARGSKIIRLYGLHGYQTDSKNPMEMMSLILATNGE